MTYLKSFVTFAIATKMVDWNFGTQGFGIISGNIISVLSGTHLVVLPIWATIFLKKNQKELYKRKFKEKYESLYQGLRLEKGP